jgi:uncharacterized membrane protein YuzA (DUF378 family)
MPQRARIGLGVALGLVLVGALNWGLVGLFQFDLVARLLGGQRSTASRAVYSAVGAAGVAILALLPHAARREG